MIYLTGIYNRSVFFIKGGILCLILIIGILFSSLPVVSQHPRLSQVEQCINALPQQRDSIAYVNVLSEIGMLYHLINRDSCLLYALKIKEISTRIRYEKGIANGLNLLGICHALKGNFKLATEYGFKALKIYRAVGDSGNTSQVLNDLAVYYANYTTDRKPEAYRYLYEAMQVASKLKAPEDSFYALILMNYVGFFKGDSTRRDSVKWAIATTYRISKQYPYSRFPFYMDLTKADSLMKAGRGHEAEAMVNSLAQAALDKGLPYVAIEMYERMDLYRSMGYHFNAVYYWERMYELGKQAGYNDLQLPTLANLYKHYSDSNDLLKKDYYSNEIMRLSASTEEVEEQSGIKYIDFFLKEQEKDALKAKTALQLQRIEKKEFREHSHHLLLTYVAILTGLMLILALRKRYDYQSQVKANTKLKQLHSDLLHKQEQLEKNDGFKNKLITIIANDFRAPLIHITKVSELLSSKLMSREDMMKVIDEIAASSGKTLLIFDSILRWIKTQLSGFVFIPVPCKPKELLDLAQHDAEQAIRERYLRVYNQVSSSAVVSADPEMLQFVHRHLLAAAIAGAVAGSEIIITGSISNERVNIYITLKAMEYLRVNMRHLFEVGKSREEQEAQQSDTGLVLIICKDFIEKMHGDIWVEDKGEGMLAFVYSLKGEGIKQKADHVM
jgi:signal transduction histidine kinase